MSTDQRRLPRDQLRVDGAHVEHAAVDRDAAVVVAAAHRHDRSQLVLVVPEFLAGLRVDRVHVVERRRKEHHAVDHDRRGLHRLEHGGLEDERGRELRDVSGVDLRAGVVARLLVAAVRMQPVVRLAAGRVAHLLRDGRGGLAHGAGGGRGRTGDFLRGEGGSAQGKQCNAGGCQEMAGGHVFPFLLGLARGCGSGWATSLYASAQAFANS